MKILVIGASQGTGALVVQAALAQGHAVTAFARSPDRLQVQHEELARVAGDFHDRASVAAAVPGHDAVILQGDIVEGRSSDQLVVKFLYNGLTDQFRECRVALKRGRDIGWHLVNAENRSVPLVVVETWSLPLVGTVGIKTLQGLCA